MEGMEKIKERILEDARREADKIIRGAEKEAQNILDHAEKTARQRKKALYEKAQKDSQEARRKTLAMAELEMRKGLLAVKQKMVDTAFERTLEKLRNLEGKDYENMIMGMMEKAVETGNEEIILSPNDLKKFKPEFLSTVNQRLSKKGIKSNLKIAEETRNIRGGFILKGEGVEVNNSFESIIRMERDEIESQVAAILFGE
jgi:V/A-type H+-transporting ATPase subunit E